MKHIGLETVENEPCEVSSNEGVLHGSIRGREVTVEMIHAALLRLGHAFDLEDVERSVSFFIPGVDFSKIPYFYLIQQISASYHDLACVR